VAFRYGEHGKPETPGLSFNVSHAGDVALIAFAGSGRVGVDVEAMRPGVEMRALARRFFTASENAALGRLPEAELAAGFYGCWTQKEAFVKAVGEGLSFELDRVEVAVRPAAAGVLSVDGDAAAGAGWSMAEVHCGPAYAAAVAVDVPGSDVVVHEWRGSAAA
jgi:4'-phosphopantetheinyl transferase